MMNDDMQKMIRESYVEYARIHQKLRCEKLSAEDRAWHQGNIDAMINAVSVLSGIEKPVVINGMNTFAHRYQKDTVDPLMKIIWENEGTAEHPKKWDDLFEYPVNDTERAQIMDRLSRSAAAVLNYCADINKEEQ